jgi:DNA polymerase III epsilon subunit-like protein
MTGINVATDEVIQVAALMCDVYTGDIESSMNYYIEAPKGLKLDTEAVAVNGYYHGKWLNEGKCPVDPTIVAPLLLKFLTTKYSAIVCHNSSLDRTFLMNFMWKYGNIEPKDQPKYWFDTASLAFLFKLKNSWSRVSLDYMKEKLHVEYVRKRYHDALDDTYLLKEVFFELIKKINIEGV